MNEGPDWIRIMRNLGQKSRDNIPLPRYVFNPCCDNNDHVSNFTEDDFEDIPRSAAESAKTWSLLKERSSAWPSTLATQFRPLEEV